MPVHGSAVPSTHSRMQSPHPCDPNTHWQSVFPSHVCGKETLTVARDVTCQTTVAATVAMAGGSQWAMRDDEGKLPIDLALDAITQVCTNHHARFHDLTFEKV